MFNSGNFKKLVAGAGIACSLGFGSAHAAISDDGVSPDGSGLSFGTGTGGMFFSIFDATNAKALVLDLNLTVSDFLANPVAPFSVTNPAVTNFIASGDVTAMQWNVAGLSNSAAPDFSSIFMLLTADPDTSPTPFASPEVQVQAMSFTSFYLQSVNNNIVGDVAETAAITTWLNGTWADRVGSLANGYNTSADFEDGEFETLSMFRVGFSGDGSASVLQDAPGLDLVRWNLDAGTGELSVSAVPIPGAVWLMGSAIAGLIGYRRRG